MTVSRLALHMVDALPLRSVWIGRPAPRRPRPLWRKWMSFAMLALASTARHHRLDTGEGASG
jgi:hypothetical protein